MWMTAWSSGVSARHFAFLWCRRTSSRRSAPGWPATGPDRAQPPGHTAYGQLLPERNIRDGADQQQAIANEANRAQGAALTVGQTPKRHPAQHDSQAQGHSDNADGERDPLYSMAGNTRHTSSVVPAQSAEHRGSAARAAPPSLRGPRQLYPLLRQLRAALWRLGGPKDLSKRVVDRGVRGKRFGYFWLKQCKIHSRSVALVVLATNSAAHGREVVLGEEIVVWLLSNYLAHRIFARSGWPASR